MTTTFRAFQLAWPASLAAMITPLLGIVDTAVLARAGVPSDIAGVALASAVISLLYWPLAFLRMSTAGQVARAHGEGDEISVRTSLVQGVCLAFCLGVLVLILNRPVISLSVLTMTDDAVSPEAIEAMRVFLEIRFWAAPFAITTTAAAGWLSGQGRTGLMSLAIISTVAVNAVLDIWFVLGLEMGVAGIALGTAIAEAFGVLAMGAAILYVLHQRGGLKRGWSRQRLTQHLDRFFALNANIFVRTLLLALTFAWFMRAGAGFGDLTLAANQVLMQIVLAAGLILDGPAIAAESLIGTAIGKTQERRAAFKAAIETTAKVTTIFALVMFIVLAIAKGPALSLVLPPDAAPTLRAETETYYLWALISPLILAFPFYLDGVFIGATLGKELRNSMILAVLGFALSTALFVPLIGNHGLWLGFGMFFIGRAIALAANWKSVIALAKDQESEKVAPSFT